MGDMSFLQYQKSYDMSKMQYQIFLQTFATGQRKKEDRSNTMDLSLFFGYTILNASRIFCKEQYICQKSQGTQLI